MALNLQSFATLVENQAAAIQARATTLIDFTIGSILRSFIEAVAAVALWLQGLVLYTLSLTRASTSQGTDLDSWMNDYGVARLGASLSAGALVFSRFSADVAGLVPIGTMARTLDGTQTFTVSLDATNPNYSSGQNGYLLPIGLTQISVPAVANTPGPNANVAANTIGLIISSTPGIDTVNNVAAFTGGSSAELDPSLRARFITFIASLSKGTKIAISYAVTSLQLGAANSIVENEDFQGNTVYGFFYDVVDDGTGTPSTEFVEDAAAAIENTRALGVRYGVFPPVIVIVSVSCSVLIAKGFDPNTVAGVAGNAITTYINSLPLGASLPYSRLAQVVYDSSPGILNVEGLLLNSATADVIVLPKNVIKLGALSVSIAPA